MLLVSTCGIVTMLSDNPRRTKASYTTRPPKSTVGSSARFIFTPPSNLLQTTFKPRHRRLLVAYTYYCLSPMTKLSQSGLFPRHNNLNKVLRPTPYPSSNACSKSGDSSSSSPCTIYDRTP